MLVFVRLYHNQLVFRLAFFMFFLLSETCRILEFVQPEEDNYLENHVIKSLMVDNKDQCKVRCYAENFCSSFNLGISETRGKLKCELSDSDHFQHPEHLICKEGFSYHPTMVGILQRKGKPKIYSPTPTPIPLLILDRRSPPWYKFLSLLSLPLPWDKKIAVICIINTEHALANITPTL